ncbi:hypothetical protein MAIC_40690 [Mycolicibacterium aichiense]|uniref:Uncharacterized protein n=1 Tax=Mycolicibacterium aichiense TaxID=1799 RepID=A0AAD1HQN7_9MYCO|nr:hypothetical protein MAIC_40690 [Mycolicibacterium aichiense]
MLIEAITALAMAGVVVDVGETPQLGSLTTQFTGARGIIESTEARRTFAVAGADSAAAADRTTPSPATAAAPVTPAARYE